MKIDINWQKMTKLWQELTNDKTLTKVDKNWQNFDETWQKLTKNI